MERILGHLLPSLDIQFHVSLFEFPVLQMYHFVLFILLSKVFSVSEYIEGVCGLD